MGLFRDRYLQIGEEVEADIVHAAELAFWFSGNGSAQGRARVQARPDRLGDDPVPRRTYRNRFARVYRERTLESADLFLAATERAGRRSSSKASTPARIEVYCPGIDVERFSAAAPPDLPPEEHVIISPGGLVWEKGHRDVMRALAAIGAGSSRRRAV